MVDAKTIATNLHTFRQDLASLQPVEVVRKHIMHGSCFLLDDAKYYELRAEVAEYFKIHPNEVLIVGSSKLGFSIAPTKRYRHFCDTSDIDVVIVDENLFKALWKTLYAFKEDGGYWEKFDKFLSYFFQGWIRPDMLPPTERFQYAKNWWEFFNSLSSTGKYSVYKIAGAIYLNWDFLESYQLRAVKSCQDGI